MGLASKVCTLVASWTWLKECPSNAAKSVSGRRASAHDFRRAFVERMQAQGMPDSLLQQLTGHRSTQMIVRYGRRKASENALRLQRQYMGGVG